MFGSSVDRVGWIYRCGRPTNQPLDPQPHPHDQPTHKPTLAHHELAVIAHTATPHHTTTHPPKIPTPNPHTHAHPHLNNQPTLAHYELAIAACRHADHKWRQALELLDEAQAKGLAPRPETFVEVGLYV